MKCLVDEMKEIKESWSDYLMKGLVDKIVNRTND